MIIKSEFKQMLKELEEFDNMREELIKSSRDVLKLSKQIIYAVHRADFRSSEKLISDIQKLVKALHDKVAKIPKLAIGSYKVAVQEYVEAVCYHGLMKSKKLLTRKELDVDVEYYLLGVCDLTGELVRNAINAGINNEFDKVIEIKKFVEELYDELMLFVFRGGELRKKFDSIKYDLKKLDQLVFDIKHKKLSGGAE